LALAAAPSCILLVIPFVISISMVAPRPSRQPRPLSGASGPPLLYSAMCVSQLSLGATVAMVGLLGGYSSRLWAWWWVVEREGAVLLERVISSLILH
jgi:hypothetical protein